jgi:hypothetical protein
MITLCTTERLEATTIDPLQFRALIAWEDEQSSSAHENPGQSLSDKGLRTSDADPVYATP